MGNMSNKHIDRLISNVIRKRINEAIDNDELNYDMRELSKAFQKANGTYHAKSSDGKWQTGDRVIVHGRTKNIEGTIKDFGENIMTWKEDCDVEFEENGQIKTLLGVPLDRIERVNPNESKKNNNKKLNEEWYPDSDEGLDDYYFGAIMTLQINGVFDNLSTEKVEELNSIGKDGKGIYIENERAYSSVMVTKVNVVPDGFDGYDIDVEVAVSAPDIPTDVIEEEVEDMVWLWIEEQTGIRSPRVYITDVKNVFDNRSRNA